MMVNVITSYLDYISGEAPFLLKMAVAGIPAAVLIGIPYLAILMIKWKDEGMFDKESK